MDSEREREYDYEIVNDRIKPIAWALVRKYGELKHIDPSAIMFVANHKSGAGRKKIILARTRKIPDKWRDALCQTGTDSPRYEHMIEFIAKATACLDENQVTALVYRELRMIDADGAIIPPDTNDWWTIIAGLGRDWFYPDSTCPNLLDAAADWKSLMGDSYEPPRAQS
jgi:hypothetical protein